jgi:predicted nucleic acid-binding Zn finger protein
MIDTQTQIERRRERAVTDIARVVNRGGHVAFSSFDVTSTSDRTYRVQIRSLTELQNSCTCPDYLTNLVGTCKHIEGVLLNLKEALGGQWDELAAQAPPVTQIYLHHAEETTIRALPAAPVPREIQVLLDRYFDAGGVLPGPGCVPYLPFWPTQMPCPAVPSVICSSPTRCAPTSTVCKTWTPSAGRRSGSWSR